MIWESRFKGEFISAAELGDRRPTLTITRIGTMRMEDEKKKKEVDKAVMFFKEIDRGWIYCKTSGHAMAAMFGKDDDNWVGKKVTLFADPEVKFGGEQVGGIRIVGSPDIAKPITIRVKFPKKKPFEMTLTPTVEKKQSTATSAQTQTQAQGGTQ